MLATKCLVPSKSSTTSPTLTLCIGSNLSMFASGPMFPTSNTFSKSEAVMFAT